MTLGELDRICLYNYSSCYFFYSVISLARVYCDPKKKKKASLVAQMVKNLPAMGEMWVQSLGQEDPLEKGMISPSILVLRISKTEEPGRLQLIGLQRVGHDLVTEQQQCIMGAIYGMLFVDK